MEETRDGTQSIERAITLLHLIGRGGEGGLRLSDLIVQSELQKPTARRLLLALIRGGLVEQDAQTRRYHVGPEAYVLGFSASRRFGIHALSLGSLSRLALRTGDSAFVSVRRDSFSVCLHCEEGSFPIRTQVLKAGDRHPLGVGAGSLAMLASLKDSEINQIISDNSGVLESKYPTYSAEIILTSIRDTRERGYAFNPGLLMPGSWGIGLPVRGAHNDVIGALSIAAIESRLQASRHEELVELLRAEVRLLEAELKKSASRPQEAESVHKRPISLRSTKARRTAT